MNRHGLYPVCWPVPICDRWPADEQFGERRARK